MAGRYYTFKLGTYDISYDLLKNNENYFKSILAQITGVTETHPAIIKAYETFLFEYIAKGRTGDTELEAGFNDILNTVQSNVQSGNTPGPETVPGSSNASLPVNRKPGTSLPGTITINTNTIVLIVIIGIIIYYLINKNKKR